MMVDSWGELALNDKGGTPIISITRKSQSGRKKSTSYWFDLSLLVSKYDNGKSILRNGYKPNMMLLDLVNKRKSMTPKRHAMLFKKNISDVYVVHNAHYEVAEMERLAAKRRHLKMVSAGDRTPKRKLKKKKRREQRSKKDQTSAGAGGRGGGNAGRGGGGSGRESISSLEVDEDIDEETSGVPSSLKEPRFSGSDLSGTPQLTQHPRPFGSHETPARVALWGLDRQGNPKPDPKTVARSAADDDSSSDPNDSDEDEAHMLPMSPKSNKVGTGVRRSPRKRKGSAKKVCVDIVSL
jgi:hypothetical protein